MPIYRGVTVELKSQFDIQTIPEFAPPHSLKGKENSITLYDAEARLVSVFIPRLESSQFWICYSITPPEASTKYFYFKLFIEGEHVTSWGCGEEDDFEGKTMFALFDGGNSQFGQCDAVKRSLFFAKKEDEIEQKRTENGEQYGVMELRLYRSSFRKRIPPNLTDFNDTHLGHSEKNGIDLVTAGRAGRGCPKRFYKYALLDPIDEPLLTFRYYHRTWEQLRDLQLDFEDNGSECVQLSGTESRLSRRAIDFQDHDTRRSSHNSSRNDSVETSTLSRTSNAGRGSGLTFRSSIGTVERAISASRNESSGVDNGSQAEVEWLGRIPSPIMDELSEYDSPLAGVRRRPTSAAVLKEVLAKAIRRRDF